MVQNIVLYIHILSAAAWIGGSILLFGMGVYFRDKAVQTTIYEYIGPFYGYFEVIWLTLLLATGSYLFVVNDFWHILFDTETVLVEWIWYKLIFVTMIVIFTAVHMTVSLRAHQRERSLKEKLISRATSMGIFILNLLILWAAMSIRDII